MLKARHLLARLVDDLLQEVRELLHDGDRLPRGEADAVHRRSRVVRRLAQPRRRAVLRVALRVAADAVATVAVSAVDGLHLLRHCRRRLRPLLDLCGGRLGRLGLRLPHRRSLLLLLPLVGVDALLVVLVPAGVLVPVAVVVANRGCSRKSLQ